MKDPREITLLDIIKIIEGDDIFNNCIIHNTTCRHVGEQKKECVLHDDYSAIRKELVSFFRSRTIHDLVKKAEGSEKIII